MLLVVVGIQRLLALEAVPATSVVTIRRFLVGLLVVPFLLGLAVVHEVQTYNEASYDFVVENVDGLAVTTAVELPRMMWFQDTEWLTVDDFTRPGDLSRLLASLAGDGPDTVSLVVLDADVPHVDDVVDQQDAWREVRRADRGELIVVVLERSAA